MQSNGAAPGLQHHINIPRSWGKEEQRGLCNTIRHQQKGGRAVVFHGGAAPAQHGTEPAERCVAGYSAPPSSGKGSPNTTRTSSIRSGARLQDAEDAPNHSRARL